MPKKQAIHRSSKQGSKQSEWVQLTDWLTWWRCFWCNETRGPFHCPPSKPRPPLLYTKTMAYCYYCGELSVESRAADDTSLYKFACFWCPPSVWVCPSSDEGGGGGGGTLNFVYCNFRKPKAFLLSFEAWKRAGPGSSGKAIVWLHAFWWRRVLPPPFGLCEEDSLSVYSGKTMLITTSLSYVYVGELKELPF